MAFTSSSPRYLTVLVEGENVLGADVRQRVILDMDSILPHLSRPASPTDDAPAGEQTTARLRACTDALLLCLEAKLTPDSNAASDGSSGVVSLPAETTQLFILDGVGDANEFVPLNSPADLVDMCRLRVVTRTLPGSYSRPSSRTSSARPPSAGPIGRSPTPTSAAGARPSSALGRSGSMRLQPRRDSRSAAVATPNAGPAEIVSFAASIVRSLAADPYSVTADSVREAAERWNADDADFEVRADDVVAGNLAAVGDIIAGAFTAGRASVGGEPANPLAAPLEESRHYCRSLEAQLAEQQSVMTMLQNALLEMREVVDQVSKDGVASAQQSPRPASALDRAAGGGSPRTMTPGSDVDAMGEAAGGNANDDEAGSVAGVSMQAQDGQSCPRTPVPMMDDGDDEGSNISDEQRSGTSAKELPSLSRFVIFFSGHTVDGATQGACAAGSEAAGKRSRIVVLRPGENPTLEMVQEQARIAFGRAASPRRSRGAAAAGHDGGEELVPGYPKKSTASVIAFADDYELHAFLVHQISTLPAKSDDTSASHVASAPLVQVFPSSAVQPAAMAQPAAATASTPPPSTFGPPELSAGDNGDEMPMPSEVHGSDDGMPVASPFVRPASALGYGSGVGSPSGLDASDPVEDSTAPQHSNHSFALGRAAGGGDADDTKRNPLPPRPPSSMGPNAASTPARPSTARISGRTSSPGSRVVVAVPPTSLTPPPTVRRAASVQGLRPIFIDATRVVIDEPSITDIFDAIRADDDVDDGAIAVDAALGYLKDRYESLGDPLRFQRLLPDRCLEHITGRPRSASIRSRAARASGLAPDRVGKEEFATMVLRIAKS